MAHGSQHDRSRLPPDCYHLQQHLPAIHGRAQSLRTLHGWRLRQCHSNGPRELPRQCPWPDVWDPAARVLFRLRPRSLRKPGRWGRHRNMEDNLLDRSRLLHRCWSRSYLFPRIATIFGSQESRQTEGDAHCVLEGDQSEAGKGVAHVYLLHYPDDLVQLLQPHVSG